VDDLAWYSAIARFDVSASFGLPMRFEYQNGGLIANFLVSDMRTGEKRWLSSVAMDVRYVTTAEGAFEALRYWAQVTALHELDECLLVDGFRCWDPHVRQPVPCLHGG